MVDKSHCKIAYDAEKDRLELSDYYDFTTSYPDAHTGREKSKANSEDEEEWENVDDFEGSAVDEVVGEIASDTNKDDEEESRHDL